MPATVLIATAEAVSRGATPRLVDVDPATGLIMLNRPERADVCARCIPVHLHGATWTYPILEVAADAHIAVLEDGASARAPTYRGRCDGTRARWPLRARPGEEPGAPGEVVCCHVVPSWRARAPAALVRRAPVTATAWVVPCASGCTAGVSLRVKLRRLDGRNAQRRRAAAESCRDAAGPGHRGALAPPASAGRPRLPTCSSSRATSRDLLRAHLTAHMASPRRHYPVPIHRTEAYAPSAIRRAACPWPRAWPSACARCRCSRASRTSNRGDRRGLGRGGARRPAPSMFLGHADVDITTCCGVDLLRPRGRAGQKLLPMLYIGCRCRRPAAHGAGHSWSSR